jgi:oxidoreductase
MALICGATGRCGGAVARELLQDGQYGPRVVCLGNTRAPVFEDERADCRQVTLEALAAGSVPRGAGDGDGDGSIFADVSTIFFCIGTTRKASGKEGQVKLELDDTVAAAKAAKAAGVSNCAIVSSKGANASSSMLYLATKGKVEDELRAIGFDRLVIARPGWILDGDRGPAQGSCKAWCLSSMCCQQTIGCEAVGRAVARAALRPGEAVEVLEHNDLLGLGE